MRTFALLLLLGLLILVGAYPALAALLAGAVALAVSGAVTLLMQPPILITGLLVLAAVSDRRRSV